QEVASGKNDGDGLRLNRGGRQVAFALQRLQDRRGEAQIGKIRQWIGSSLVAAPVSRRADDHVEAQPTGGRTTVTPRVSWVVGWNFSGRSTGGRSGKTARKLVLHAA